jgi:hypothetical protein
MCDHPRSSAPGLLLLPRSSSLHAMPHLPPAHHETSKRNSPNEIKIKEKQNKTFPDSNSNLAKSMTHHNQTKELTTWFLRPVGPGRVPRLVSRVGLGLPPPGGAPDTSVVLSSSSQMDDLVRSCMNTPDGGRSCLYLSRVRASAGSLSRRRM